MYSRIIFLKQFSKTLRHVLVTKQLGPSPKNSILRCLHVKRYDKIVSLESEKIAQPLPVPVDEQRVERNVHLFPKVPKSENNPVELILNEKSSRANISKPLEIVSDTKSEDPDVFGNAPKEPFKDEDDLLEEESNSRPTRRSKKLRTKEYASMIKEHLNNHRLKEAIEIVEIRMIKEDRVKPENYIYNLLISGCAKAGYTRKAFNLYTKMKQRGLEPKQSTYTSLFNACANAPSREDGLTRAIRLRESLLESGYEFNIKNYNVMIKTFGHWGDVKTAYILVDEMRDKKLQMTRETFNFLFQACASDEKYGFRHCLLTWHKMLRKNIKPDYYTFNAVLRCTRDSGFGDLNEMEHVLQRILKKSVKFVAEEDSSGHSEFNKGPTEDKENSNIELNTPVQENCLQISNEPENLQLPNLLAPVPHLGSMISLSEVKKPHERFLLLGGLTGFLELMKSRKVTPDIETFTTMLEVIPPTNAAEKQVLTYIRKINLKADIDFFNILIKKRAMRFDYEGGKEVISMIRAVGLYPDIVTYGVLALGCTTIESSRELLEEMRRNSIRMNIKILGAMLRQGCAQKAIPYICEIMQISLDENILPNDIFLKHLHNYYLHSARAIDARHPSTKTKRFKKEYKKFCDKYRLYKEEHGIDGLKLEDAIKKIKERPYDQYKEERVSGMEHLKNEKLLRKNKLRKYIKKIKIQSLKDDIKETDNKILYFPTARTENDGTDHMTNEKNDNFNTNNPFRAD